MHILIVLTNVGKIGNTDKKTGFHMSEFTHPYEFFVSHGYDVTVASPLGGECPITSPHPEDPINAKYFADPHKMKIVKSTKKLRSLTDKRFDAIYVAGGHGAMFDLANNSDLAGIMVATYEKGGVVAAVCHGPAAFVGVRDQNGNYIVAGKNINSFTNEEEQKTPYYNDMPFLLETKLIEQGGLFKSSAPRQPHLEVAERIVTGQNPESVDLVTGAVQALLQKA